MLRIRDRRVRIVVVVILLLLIGVAVYQIGTGVWVNRQKELAQSALDRFDFEGAEGHLANGLALRPGDATLRVLLAQTARRRGDFDTAARLLYLAEKHGAPVEALSAERQFLSIQAGDLSSAAQLTDYCSRHPESPETALALEALTEGSLRAFQVPLATWCVELWLKHRMQPEEQAQGLVWRGRLHLIRANTPQALVDFGKAAELAPDRPQARLRLAETLLREDPRQAIPHIDWLRAHRPDDAEVRLLSARLRRNLGEPEEAGKLLDAILQASPEQVPALIERGRVALDLNRPQEAEPLLLHAQALAPEQRDVQLALADCMRLAGRFDDAQRYQSKALEIEERQRKKLAELMGSKDKNRNEEKR